MSAELSGSFSDQGRQDWVYFMRKKSKCVSELQRECVHRWHRSLTPDRAEPLSAFKPSGRGPQQQQGFRRFCGRYTDRNKCSLLSTLVEIYIKRKSCSPTCIEQEKEQTITMMILVQSAHKRYSRRGEYICSVPEKYTTHQSITVTCPSGLLAIV